MPPRLRGAIIGCGYFAQFQVAAWRRMADVEIVAASDLDADRARAAAPRVYTSAAEMLDHEQLDFVDIATRPASHLELVRLTLGRGIPTICQKPMASTWDEALEMASLSQQANVPLVIHENWRWQPWFREARRLMQAGAIGKPVSYCFRTRQRDGLGESAYARQPYFREMPRLLVYETVVHHIDTARFLFGPIDSLYARVRRHNPNILGEDCALLVVKHAAEVDGVIDGHRFLDPDPSGPAMGEAWIDGDEAGLRINARGEIFRGAEVVFQAPPALGYKGDSVFATQRHFIDCLRTGATAESSAAAYLETFAAVEAAYRSVAERREVRPAEFLSQPNSP
jgi:predicted dehydrogenase